MKKELTIGQFFGVLSENLIVVDSKCEPLDVIRVIASTRNVYFQQCDPAAKNYDCLHFKQDFQIYFQDSDTYLSLHKGQHQKLVDLIELISYAMKGQLDMLLAKSLSI